MQKSTFMMRLTTRSAVNQNTVPLLVFALLSTRILVGVSAVSGVLGVSADLAVSGVLGGVVLFDVLHLANFS